MLPEWKRKVPQELKSEVVLNKYHNKFSKSPKPIASMTPTSVMFVPNTHNSVLLKRLQEREPMISRLSGYTVRLIEGSGTPFSCLFPLNFSNGTCKRADCPVCLNPSLKGPSRCKTKSIVYESRCSLCKSIGSKAGTYIGESGRSLCEHCLEHLEDAKDRKPSSHIWKHWALNYPNELPQVQS